MYDNWEELEQECNNCKKCKLCSTRINVVIGDGNKEADLMFIGEGPRSRRRCNRNSICWKSRKTNGHGISGTWHKT